MAVCGFIICLCLCFLYAVKAQESIRLLDEIEKSRKEYHGVTNAMIYEVEHRLIMRSMEYYYPQFTYEVDGQTYWGRGEIYSTVEQDFIHGASFEIRYDEKHPESFMIADDESLYQMAMGDKKSNLSWSIGVWGIYLIFILFY